MKFSRKVNIGLAILKAKWLNRKRPIAVGWSLTKRCNFNCGYCGSDKRVGRELSDRQLMLTARQFVDAGVMKVSFTGGEPLLREKIVDIVPFLLKNNVTITIDTNGKKLPEMIHRLDGVDGVLLSLDGARETNDEIRGKGAYDATINALKAANDKGLRVVMTCVLSKWNLDDFPHVLDVARRYGTTVQFQPAIITLLGIEDKNPGSPEPEAFHKVIDRIIAMKKNIFKNEIGNSAAGLAHLKEWPRPKTVRCISGLVSARVEPDGSMYHCGRVIANTKDPPNILDHGFREAFEKLTPFDCPDCWCAQRVELMLATEINLDVIRNMLSIY